MIAIVEAAGWPIWFLVLASVIAVGLIVERLIYLRSNRIAPPALLNEVVNELKQRGVSDSMLSKLAGGSPLGRIFAAGLKNIKSPPEVMKESIEEAGRMVAHELERFLTTLGTIASISPLLGLFGTVVGMIEIFGSQNAAGQQPGDPRSRHFRGALQHRIRPDRGHSQHDFLPPLPRPGGQPDHRNGTAGNQAGGNRSRPTQGLSSMNFQRGRSREEPEINLIAMIDVLLVILIFLMVTTTYAKFAELQINLPQAGGEEAPQGQADQCRGGCIRALRHQ